MLFKTIGTALILLLAGCSPQLSDYAGVKPALHPEQFFNGDLESYGIVDDELTHRVKHFTMHAIANWHENTGSMHESFHFEDGTGKERQWQFYMQDKTHFIGTAPDVEGNAYGELAGNCLHWVYRIHTVADGKETLLTFDDWLYLVDENHLFSRVSIRKWGLPVGDMTMFFIKTEKGADVNQPHASQLPGSEDSAAKHMEIGGSQ